MAALSYRWVFSFRRGGCSFITAFFFYVMSAVAATGNFSNVILVENHGDILVPWIKTGIRNAVVVNVDAHDDCLPISKPQIGKLKSLFAAGNMDEIARANGAADFCLYNSADYLTAAHALGIAREVVWAAPLPSALSKVRTHLPFKVLLIDSIAALRFKGPVLLTVDADCVDHFARYRCIALMEAIRRIVELLRKAPWDVVHVSVCYSCDGGYLPITMRWVGNAMVEALEGRNILRDDAPWSMLAMAEDWRRSLLPKELVRRLQPLTLERPRDPWLRVYLAEALFRAADVSGALSEGKKASRLDTGCSRILAELGGQLADMGRLDDAERFLSAAPAGINSASELALAQALDIAGYTKKAIKYYSLARQKTANYSIDLLMGYAYERLGDEAKARQHYLSAVNLLAQPVGEMAGFADLTLSVAAAERFFRKTGDQRSAEALRRDHRLAIYFNKPIENSSVTR